MKTKKLITTAFTYAIAAMVGGVFYREFTKFNGFVDTRTTLGFVHGHLFMLGMAFFLIAALCEKSFGFSKDKRFNLFYGLYNTGLSITAIMFVVRGIFQVLQLEMSKGISASISGIAGLGHILLGVGIIIFFLMLKKQGE